MNQKIFIFSFYHHPHLNSYIIIIILFSLLTTITICSSENPRFKVCQSQTCGNHQNISYPFYIRGKQEPYCGFPGYELLCSNNGFPILNLSNTLYIIQEISYENRSLRLSHPSFSASNSINCLPPPTNLTLDGDAFQFAPNQKDMFLIYGCDQRTVSLGLQEHEVTCAEANETGSVVALYREDRNLSFALENCGGEVVAMTVEEEREDIGEALRRGFLLNWKAVDCSQCKQSGGKCGFDYDIYTFQCYCPDRAHFKECTHPPAPAPLPPGWSACAAFNLFFAVVIYHF